jgi:diguanylate cyclase (GGDEF)-like protein
MQVSVAGLSLRRARAQVRLAWRRCRRRPQRAADRTSGAARAFIGRMGLLITCLTMFGPPAVYAAWTLWSLEQRALQYATVGARHLEAQLSLQLTGDSLSQAASNVLKATSIASSAVVATWVTNRDGKLMYFQGGQASWPERTVSAPIRAFRFDGRLYVALAMRALIINTCGVFAAFLLLGLAANYYCRRLPLLALDEALRQLNAKQEELLLQKAELETQNERFDAALNNMSQGLCLYDREQKLVVCNASYVQMYGLAPELAEPGTPLAKILEHRIGRPHGAQAGDSPEDALNEMLTLISERRPATKILELGDRRVIAIKHQPMPQGGWISSHEDITEYRRIEARIAHMAHHDVLTELPNRLLLRERLERAVAGPRREKGLAVLGLDLDRFKLINDTLGHATGDALLKAVGERLRNCVREGDTVARLGGDEFSIVQIASDQPLAATALATRIIAAIAAPFDLGNHQVTVGTSIGIAVYGADGDSPDQLLKNADLALYRAKNEGRGVHRFFEPDMDRQMQARSALQLDLRTALAEGQFELHYQPLVNLERNAISGLEALLRWRHPTRGTVAPAEFVPLAEENGLIVPIGAWVLRQACLDAAELPGSIKIAVNLSAVQLRNRQLVETVLSALAASGLPAQRLELEITESVLLENSEATLQTLHTLRELGVRIALDDFGTGYSSLGYLRRFPFDKIKIDRCFVADLSATAQGPAAILRALAGLGSSLGMITTAEGVETSEQVKRVRAEGLTEMQGYVFSPPRPIADIARLFLAGGAQTATAAEALLCAQSAAPGPEVLPAVAAA